MKKAFKFVFLILLIAALTFSFPVSVPAETLTVYPEEALHPVSPTLYGIFIEDINCAVDGGLYAELLKNRSFENQSIQNPRPEERWDAWRFIKRENGETAVAFDRPLHENNPAFLRVSLGENGVVSMANQGFGGNTLRGGIPVEAGKEYDFSLWLRFPEDAGKSVSVSAALTGAGGNLLSEEAFFWFSDTASAQKGNGWKKYEAEFTAKETAGAVLRLTVQGSGTVDADMLSLLPADRVGAAWPGGGMRSDLVDALRELHPRFMRFPGGCVVEGSYVWSDAYDWKAAVGNVEDRRETGNTWGGMLTMGVGFYEYFCLAEEIGALPVPVVHSGVLCQARQPAEAPLTMEETAAYAQDVLDLLEFALGGADTFWGGLRAEMGHPAPFDLRYVAIGNENWDAVYFNRYAVIRNIVKEQYPDITCIVAAGPVAEGGLIDSSWRTIRSRFPDDLVDEHYYMDSDWFPRHVTRYDRYPRTTKVFLGEYAAHEPVQGSRRPNNLYAALCEAAYLTGVERNSDLVEMSCYAPLLSREGQVDWTPDLIWFDEKEVYNTPSYYVQQMFSDALGDRVVKTEGDGKLFQIATRTEQEVQIKVVNLADEPCPLTLRVLGANDQTGEALRLTGEKKHVNSFARPDKIVPVPLSFVLQKETLQTELPPWSLTVFRFALP